MILISLNENLLSLYIDLLISSQILFERNTRESKFLQKKESLLDMEGILKHNNL